MRIPSGVVDQYIYFVAVDATDLKTRETGLSSFTVYRSRNGAAAAAMTTPTINETSSANMPGVYELLLDEDMTIDSGDDSQEVVYHITHAGMAPVTRSIELYRAKLTAGQTLTVSGGAGNSAVQSIAANAITATSIAANAITATKIATDSITAAKIAADAIGASELAADAASEIATSVWAAVTRTLTAATNLSALAQASVCTETRLAELDAANLPTDIAATQSDLDILTGLDGATLATTQANYAPSKAGDLMGLANDAITAAKYDESTAFPLISADTGDTQVARTGADSDTLETISDQVGNLSTGSAAISTTAASFAKAGAEPETLTYTATHQLDLSYHEVEDDAGTTDAYYEFDVGGNGVATEILWTGYAQSNGDSYLVRALNWPSTWEQVGLIPGTSGTTPVSETFQLNTGHVGMGTDIGKVRLKFYSTDGTKIATDRILCSYAVVSQSVGYAAGSIWVDSAGESGSVAYVNGTADNPCPWADAQTLNTALGLNRFHIANGNTLTLDALSDNYTVYGEGWTLALGGQSIDGAAFEGATTVTGTATATTKPSFNRCVFGAATVPPGVYTECGIGLSSGQFTAGSAGEYVFNNCISLVPGSGSPALVFSGNGASSGINNRGWKGGATYTLDSDCTLSHEVLAGGGTTITTGGANVEVRGITRSLTVAMSAAETVQFAGITGPIALSGTTTATVNLYGVSASLSDTTSAATVTDKTVSQDAINTEADTALTDYDGPTNAEMEARTPTAAQLAYIVANAATGMPVTFTDSGGTTTNAVLDEVDGAAASATADQYNGRLLVFTDGNLKGVVTDITDYDGSNNATITAIPFAPTSSHNARLI